MTMIDQNPPLQSPSLQGASGAAAVPKSVPAVAIKDIPARPDDFYCPTPANMRFFQRIDPSNDGTKRALRALSQEVATATANTTRHKPVLDLKSRTFFGNVVKAGEVGLVMESGLPRLIIEPGKYWMFPSLNRTFVNTMPLKALDWNGFTTRLMAPNEAAVVTDPADHVFPVNGPGGFASYNLAGDYKTLSTVDRKTVDPNYKVMDPDTGNVLLGHRLGVLNENKSCVAQFLNIPANNVALVQRGNKFEMIDGGQHTITDPQVTFRRFFTRGDMVIDAAPEDVYTKDQVAVSIKLAVKLQLTNPEKLVEHGFDSPYQALRDPIQSTLISVVSRLRYTDFMSQQGIGMEARDPNSDVKPFEEAVQNSCLEKLKASAREYGIELKFVQVTNRTFRGNLVQTLADLTTRTMKVNQEAELVKTENSNRQMEAQGKQLVTQVEAQQIETLAQASYIKSVKESEAAAQAKINAAEADKKAQVLRAEGEAQAIEKLATARANAVNTENQADTQVQDPHAKSMQTQRISREQIAAMAAGKNIVFLPHDAIGAVATSSAVGLGLKIAGVNQNR